MYPWQLSLHLDPIFYCVSYSYSRPGYLVQCHTWNAVLPQYGLYLNMENYFWEISILSESPLFPVLFQSLQAFVVGSQRSTTMHRTDRQIVKYNCGAKQLQNWCKLTIQVPNEGAIRVSEEITRWRHSLVIECVFHIHKTALVSILSTKTILLLIKPTNIDIAPLWALYI